MNTERQYYTPKEIAAIVGISYDAAVGLIRTSMVHLRVGKRILVRVCDFERWQDEAKIVPDGNGTPRVTPYPATKPMTDAEKLALWHKNRRAAMAQKGIEK